METDKVVYSGYLLLPPQGKIVLKKSWQQKFCLLYKQSKFGIERLEIYDTSEDVTKHAISRIITLENCVKITPISTNSFKVITKNMQYDFMTPVEEELTSWVTAIQSVAFKDDVSKITSIEEDNDLYCSSGEGVFQVTLWSSEASKRCGLEPNKFYTLVLTSATIQLRNACDNKILYTWPYCYIRRYGYRSGKFTFEAGRKCESGEGVFHLEHSNQQQIFRCLSSKMKSMKKILSGESTSSLLDCGDNQFQAALSMEARSRSPLPPSPTSSTRIHDIDLSNSNQSSTKTIATFTDCIEKSIGDRRPLPKPRPTKPPRKNLPISIQAFLQDKFNSDNSYEPQYEPSCDYEAMPIVTPDNRMKYDEIEVRKEAWKTQGLSEIKHTESVECEEDLEDYVSWGRQNKSDNAQNMSPVLKNSPKIIKLPNSSDEMYDNAQNISPVIKNSPKIISKLPNSSDEMYDKLTFFGSSSKLTNINSGYKQVSPVSVNPLQYTPSWSDYDEVEVNNMQSVRRADDSHLGYGMIRKAVQPKVTENSQVSHQVYNDSVYAVVSKPKQV